MTASESMVLGLDLGTSSCKARLVSTRQRSIAEASADYPTHAPHPSWAEQNPADWLTAATEATRGVLAQANARPAPVAAVALSSAAHIGVLLDDRGEPVRPAILWNDQRSSEQVERLEREAGEDIVRATCQAVATCWTLPQLCWVREHEPDAWHRTRSIVLSKDYLVRWLTGRAVTDPATALSAQLYDVGTEQWSEPLCALAGIAPGMLPPIEPATAQVGGVTAHAAELLGLRAGTPVIVGSLDSAAELLAAGIVAPGQAMIRLATAGGVQIVTPAPVPRRDRITYPHVVTPHWYCQAGTNTCAAAVEWGRRLFAGDGELTFEQWDREAGDTPPGAAELIFHPYLAGERAPLWNPHVRGDFVGLSLHHHRGHLARAIYEGTACSIRHAMAVLSDCPRADEPMAVSGGGTRSELWLQILADVLQAPLRITTHHDSAFGAALLGLQSLGLAHTPAPSAEETPHEARPVACARERAELYERIFERYVRLQQQIAPSDGSETSARPE